MKLNNYRLILSTLLVSAQVNMHAKAESLSTSSTTKSSPPNLTVSISPEVKNNFSSFISYKAFVKKLSDKITQNELTEKLHLADIQYKKAQNEETNKNYANAADLYGMAARKYEWVYRNQKYKQINSEKTKTSLVNTQKREINNIILLLKNHINEKQIKIIISQWNYVKNKYMKMSYEEYMKKKYHDFSHTMDNVKIVAQGIANQKTISLKKNTKAVLKAILAALFHDLGYTEMSTETHNHVEESVAMTSNHFNSLSKNKNSIINLSSNDICDILKMISATSITDINFEQQENVKKLRLSLAKNGLKNSELKDYLHYLLVADLVGAATTDAYLRNLIPLYREFYCSINSDTFGSGLCLLYGSSGFQEYYAKNIILKKELNVNSLHEVNNFLTKLFTKEQLERYNTNIEILQYFKNISDHIAGNKQFSSLLVKIADSEKFFTSYDFNNIINTLKILNSLIKSNILSNKNKAMLKELATDPAFELEATYVLLLQYANGNWRTSNQERIKNIYNNFNNLCRRNIKIKKIYLKKTKIIDNFIKKFTKTNKLYD